MTLTCEIARHGLKCMFESEILQLKEHTDHISETAVMFLSVSKIHIKTNDGPVSVVLVKYRVGKLSIIYVEKR